MQTKHLACLLTAVLVTLGAVTENSLLLMSAQHADA